MWTFRLVANHLLTPIVHGYGGNSRLKDMEGTIEMVNGKKRATIILDKLGVFKFTLPVSQLRKI